MVIVATIQMKIVYEELTLCWAPSHLILNNSRRLG